jgi:hypothetical protein
MTFVSASVMFLWIGFSHVYKEADLHRLVTTAAPITTHTTLNMGTAVLLTDVANFFYYD